MSARRPSDGFVFLWLIVGGWDTRDANRWAKLGNFGSHRYCVGALIRDPLHGYAPDMNCKEGESLKFHVPRE